MTFQHGHNLKKSSFRFEKELFFGRQTNFWSDSRFHLFQEVADRGLNLIELSIAVAMRQGLGKHVVKPGIELAVVANPGMRVAAGQNLVQLLVGQGLLVGRVLVKNLVGGSASVISVSSVK